MEKRQFPKKSITLTPVDLKMLDGEMYEEIKFKFWDNPSRSAVIGLFKFASASGEFLEKLSVDKLRQVEEEFYYSVSQIVIDTNIDGISFDTPDLVKEAFEADFIPMGFLMEAVTAYVTYMLEYNDKVKKALALFLLAFPSGTGKGKKEPQSSAISSTVPNESSKTE